VDSRRREVFDRDLTKTILILRNRAYDPGGWHRLKTPITKLNKIVLYLFMYHMNIQTFRPAGCTADCTTGCKVYTDLEPTDN